MFESNHFSVPYRYLFQSGGEQNAEYFSLFPDCEHCQGNFSEICHDRLVKQYWEERPDGIHFGVLTGIAFEMSRFRMTDAFSYGINPDAAEFFSVSEENKAIIREFLAQTVDSQLNRHDCPIIYRRKGPDIQILCIGNPVPKRFYGQIRKYDDNFEGGLIFPRKQTGGQAKSLSFLGRDIVNAQADRLNTKNYYYDVSYTQGEWQNQDTKPQDIFIFSQKPVLSAATEQGVNLEELKKWAQQNNAFVQEETLPPLPQGKKYGIIYYYKYAETFDTINITNLFKNQRDTDLPEDILGSEQSDGVRQSPQDHLTDEAGRQLDTKFLAYLVSYVPFDSSEHISVCRKFIAGNFLMIRTENGRLLTVRRQTKEDNKENIEKRIEHICQQFPDSIEREELAPLPNGEQYGILHFYNSSNPYFLVTDHYISRIENIPPDYQNTRTILNQNHERLYEKNESPDTTVKIYLISVTSGDTPARCIESFDKFQVLEMWLFGSTLLKRTVPAQKEEERDIPRILKPPKVETLPPLPDESYRYAIVSNFARTYLNIFFYDTVEKNQNSDRLFRRQHTIAKADSATIRFRDSETSEPVVPSAMLNTIRYLYIVRIKTEEPDGTGSVPDVREPVLRIRLMSRLGYERIEIQGTSLLIYSNDDGSIIQDDESVGSSETPFEDGETILIDNQWTGIKAETYTASAFHPNQDETIYRFGILTKLFKNPVTNELTGGLMNDDVYFSMNAMSDQVRNIIQTHKKRLLLLYTSRNHTIRIERPFLSQEWDNINIPWKKGIFQGSTVSASESSVDIETEDDHQQKTVARHYISPDTDGYVNNVSRSGQMNGQTVFLKEIFCKSCPGEDNPLVRVAVLLHCEREQAIIRYDQTSSLYLSRRYNPFTGLEGTIPIPVFGDKSLLDNANGQKKEIVFSPFQDKPSVLYARLPGENDTALTYEELRDKLQIGNSPMKQLLMRMDSQLSVAESPMGQFLMSRAKEDPRYLCMFQYIDSGENNGEDEEILKKICLSSGEWENTAMLAALLMNSGYYSLMTTHIKEWNSSISLLSPNSYLRKALRSYMYSLMDPDHFESFFAAALPILRSNTENPRSIIRDLYCYLTPCFHLALKSRTTIRDNIFYHLSNTDEQNDLFEEKYQELLNTEPEADDVDLHKRAAYLLPQLIALDSFSLKYLKDSHRTKLPQKLVTALLEILDNRSDLEKRPDTELLFDCLENRRRQVSDLREEMFLTLEKALNNSDSVCHTISDMKNQENFRQLLANLNTKDRQNLEKLTDLCSKAAVPPHDSPAEKLRRLHDIIQKLEQFREHIKEYPTHTTIGLLFVQNRDILDQINRELAAQFNDICREQISYPYVSIEPNCRHLQEEQQYFTLNIVNGSPGGTDNPDIELNSISLHLPSDTSIELKQSSSLPPVLLSGKLCSVRFRLPDIPSESQSVRMVCEVKYKYLLEEEFLSDLHRCKSHYQDRTTDNSWNLTIAADSGNKPEFDNPYSEWVDYSWHNGSDMFFGRENELKTAVKALTDQTGSYLKKGRILLIHGQKQSGKTSFLNKLQADFLDNQPNTVVLLISDIYREICRDNSYRLHTFTDRFYAKLLEKLTDKLDGRSDVNPLTVMDCRKKMQQSVRISDKADLFESLMKELNKEDIRIVLIIDEFTRLCTEVRDRNPRLSSIFGFIRYFSEQYGLIQIIAGHHSMMQMFRDMGILNSIATAQSIPLTALDETSAKEMITQPMKRILNIDPYDTPSGKLAVDKLLDLTGRYTSYLMILCDKMCNRYQKMPEYRFDLFHVEDMLVDLFHQDNGDVIFQEIFDPLLDDSNTDDEIRDISEYLEKLSKITYDLPNHECDRDRLMLDNRTRNNAIRDILITRDVLTSSNGMIRINVGLYREYIRRKH